MERRKKAAVLLSESRGIFYRNISLGNALQKAEEALSLLNDEECSPRFIKWVILLRILKTGTCPQSLLKRLPRQGPYMGIILFYLIRSEKLKQADTFFKECGDLQTDTSEEEEKPFYHYLATYMYALVLYKLKKYEESFSLLSDMIKELDEEHIGELLLIMLAFAYSLIGQYYEKRGFMTLSEAMMHKCFQLVEKTKAYFITAILYVQLAEFYVVNYPTVKGVNILERITQISEYFADQRLIVEIEKQWAYFFIYSGDTESFWKKIRGIQKMARKTNNRYFLANSYYLEAMYHLYNKNMEAAESHIRRALNTYRNDELEGKCQRAWAIIPLLFSDYDETVRRFNSFDYKHAGFGFENVLNFGVIQEKEELTFYFNAFFKGNNTLWIEETLLGFFEKLTILIPDMLHKYLKQSLAEQRNSNMRLVVAILNEVLGRSYLKLENYEEARFYLGKALMLYKQMGFLNAAKYIDGIVPANETDLLGLRDSIEGFVAEKGDKDMIANFTSCRYICESNIKKLKVMDEIMEFSRCVDLNNDISSTLKQILYWISSFIRAKKSFITLMEKHSVLEHYEINFEKVSVDDERTLLLQTEDITSFSPLKIKRTYVIDDTRLVIVYLENDDFSGYFDEEFFRIFLNEIEPILSLYIKNTLYMQQSIYDSLTHLYSRWYYEDRFREEFEKAIRYNTSLSYIICDIDSFKKVNDTYGHQTGDEVLKEIARIILDNIRKFDIAARFGGEEFAIILPNTALVGAEKVAEKIRSELEKISIFPFNVTMSFGVNSLKNREYDNYKQLEKHADMALYQAKESGKNKVVLFESKNHYDELDIKYDF